MTEINRTDFVLNCDQRSKLNDHGPIRCFTAKEVGSHDDQMKECPDEIHMIFDQTAVRFVLYKNTKAAK